MKCTIFIDKEREEEVIIYSHEENRLVASIKTLAESGDFELTGFDGKQSVPLDLSDIFFFTVENGKVYAVTEKECFLLKKRLYQLSERLPKNFIKINQSCIANIKKIDRFDASVSGALKVKFKNGSTDYVSRRNMKSIKERLGY